MVVWLLAVIIIGLGAVAYFIEFMITSYEDRIRAGIWCALLVVTDWLLLEWLLAGR